MSIISNLYNMHNVIKKRTTEVPFGEQLVFSILSGYDPPSEMGETTPEHIKAMDRAMYLYHILCNVSDSALKGLLKKSLPDIALNVEDIKRVEAEFKANKKQDRTEKIEPCEDCKISPPNDSKE